MELLNYVKNQIFEPNWEVITRPFQYIAYDLMIDELLMVGSTLFCYSVGLAVNKLIKKLKNRIFVEVANKNTQTETLTSVHKATQTINFYNNNRKIQTLTRRLVMVEESVSVHLQM